jgi:glycerate dehydrogenase
MSSIAIRGTLLLRPISIRAFSTTPSAGHSSNKPRAVFLNASRLNYDGALDFASWHGLVDVHLHPVDAVRDEEEMVDLADGAEIVITKEMALPASAFARFPPSVRLLCEAGTGYNNLPVREARERGVLVCNIPTYSTEAVAHMAITYLMNFSVSMFQQQAMLLNNDRANFTGPFTLPLREINGKTLGLVGGAGRIGTKVAEIGLALGMDVVISSRRGSLPEAHPLRGHPRVRCTRDVDELLRESDYVSLHTPLNAETRGTFGDKQIRQMKPTAFLINTSRGAVCNEEELIKCMEDRVIAGAGLDVTTTEPPRMDSKLWELDNGTFCSRRAAPRHRHALNHEEGEPDGTSHAASFRVSLLLQFGCHLTRGGGAWKLGSAWST